MAEHHHQHKSTVPTPKNKNTAVSMAQVADMPLYVGHEQRARTPASTGVARLTMVTNSVRFRLVRVTPWPVHTPGPEPE